MNAKQALEDLAPKIDKVILDVLDKEIDFSHNVSPLVSEILEYTSALAEGGKRLRGSFMYYSYLMFGGKDIDEILKTSAFIELVHAYLLVHDDIMDNAELRRGTPTVHKIYKDIHSTTYNKGDSKHFGEGIALCTGDVLCHLGTKILIDSNFDPQLKLRALSKFHRRIIDVGYGQILDEFLEVKENPTKGDVLHVHLYKTGYYTYETPLHMGAILAGASDEELKVLTEYAIPGGIAFQLQDDVLGMFGDEERIGKPADSDLKEGKQTLLIIKALEKGDDNQKLIIRNALGNPNITEETLNTVRKIIIDTGSLDYSKKLAVDLVKQAKSALETNPNPKWTKEGSDFLHGIADYMINRDL